MIWHDEIISRQYDIIVYFTLSYLGVILDGLDEILRTKILTLYFSLNHLLTLCFITAEQSLNTARKPCVHHPKTALKNGLFISPLPCM